MKGILSRDFVIEKRTPFEIVDDAIVNIDEQDYSVLMSGYMDETGELIYCIHTKDAAILKTWFEDIEEGT